MDRCPKPGFFYYIEDFRRLIAKYSEGVFKSEVVLKMNNKNDDFMRIYTISELSNMINIPEGTIRQWEKNLEGIIEVPRDEKGARYYTEFEVNLFKNIRAMREKVLSWSVIKEVLKQSEAVQNENPLTPMMMPTLPKMTQSEAIQSLQEIRLAIEGFEQKMKTIVQQEIKNEVATSIQPISKAIESISDGKKEKEQEERMNALLNELEQMKTMIEEMKQDKEKKKSFLSRWFGK